MWTDPMDELIADLEQIAPPEQGQYGGGQDTLGALRDDPVAFANVLRGSTLAHLTLKGMLSAMLRFISLTLDDHRRADRVREQILSGLYPRPERGRSWYVLPRSVGGSRLHNRQRPILSEADLKKIVSASPKGDTIQKKALRATYLWSGITSGELATIKWEQLELLEPSDEHLFCAVIHDIPRRRRLISIPVAEEARPYLQSLLVGASPPGLPPSGPMFPSPRGGSLPIHYDTVRAIIRLAVSAAGLPDCDDIAFKRAYAAILKQRGLNDYAVRDALGVESMDTVDRLLSRHESEAAQRAVTGRKVVQAIRPEHIEPAGSQLTLGLESSVERRKDEAAA